MGLGSIETRIFAIMSKDIDTGSLYVHIEHRVATVKFSHPKQNSFPRQLLQRLTKTFEDIALNKEVHVILLKSDEDHVFSAGASFDELLQINSPEEGKHFFMGFANLINAIRKCPQPVVGRIHGRAIGGGVGLVAACDYAIATEKASVKLSEIAIGIGPFVISPAVSRKIGVAALSELALTAHQWKNAYWAKEKGLYAQVFDNSSKMDKELDLLLSKLASYSPQGVAALKKSLWNGTDHWDQLLAENAAISGRLVLSDITQQTLKTFKKKS